MAGNFAGRVHRCDVVVARSPSDVALPLSRRGGELGALVYFDRRIRGRHRQGFAPLGDDGDGAVLAGEWIRVTRLVHGAGRISLHLPAGKRLACSSLSASREREVAPEEFLGFVRNAIDVPVDIKSVDLVGNAKPTKLGILYDFKESRRFPGVLDHQRTNQFPGRTAILGSYVASPINFNAIGGSDPFMVPGIERIRSPTDLRNTHRLTDLQDVRIFHRSATGKGGSSRRYARRSRGGQSAHRIRGAELDDVFIRSFLIGSLGLPPPQQAPLRQPQPRCPRPSPSACRSPYPQRPCTRRWRRRSARSRRRR